MLVVSFRKREPEGEVSLEEVVNKLTLLTGAAYKTRPLHFGAGRKPRSPTTTHIESSNRVGEVRQSNLIEVSCIPHLIEIIEKSSTEFRNKLHEIAEKIIKNSTPDLWDLKSTAVFLARAELEKLRLESSSNYQSLNEEAYSDSFARKLVILGVCRAIGQRIPNPKSREFSQALEELYRLDLFPVGQIIEEPLIFVELPTGYFYTQPDLFFVVNEQFFFESSEGEAECFKQKVFNASKMPFGVIEEHKRCWNFDVSDGSFPTDRHHYDELNSTGSTYGRQFSKITTQAMTIYLVKMISNCPAFYRIHDKAGSFLTFLGVDEFLEKIFTTRMVDWSSGENSNPQISVQPIQTGDREFSLISYEHHAIIRIAGVIFRVKAFLRDSSNLILILEIEEHIPQLKLWDRLRSIYLKAIIANGRIFKGNYDSGILLPDYNSEDPRILDPRQYISGLIIFSRRRRVYYSKVPILIS
ncbi:MAG: hypothetical protein NZO16_01850 [Deltaproteobacteria bacterium]|nr:hypothetical protein [Deltaproteobacteria bacterium]